MAIRKKNEISSNFKTQKHKFFRYAFCKIVLQNYVSVGKCLFFVEFETKMHQNVEKTFRGSVIHNDGHFRVFSEVFASTEATFRYDVDPSVFLIG